MLVPQKQKNSLSSNDSGKDDHKTSQSKWKGKEAKLTMKTDWSHVQTPKSDTEGVATSVALSDSESEQDAGESEAENKNWSQHNSVMMERRKVYVLIHVGADLCKYQ